MAARLTEDPSVSVGVIEAGVSFGWDRYIGDEGVSIAIDHFGESAPGEELMEKFGFSVKNVVSQAKKLLNK